jgi:hypothetical protein
MEAAGRPIPETSLLYAKVEESESESLGLWWRWRFYLTMIKTRGDCVKVKLGISLF